MGNNNRQRARTIGPAPPPSLLQDASLFLDFDGTLVDIADDPSLVSVTRELRELLELLKRKLEGRVVILSGRSLSEVEAFLAPVSLSVGGSHGLETRIAGQQAYSTERPAELDEVVERLRVLEREFPGVLVEDKPLGVALHYRLAPGAESACREATTEAARSANLHLQPGKMVFELKPRGTDKGDALRAIMAGPEFDGTRPIFLGDDLTDEPGFAAAQELHGAGIRIGEPRETEARYALPSVGAALHWLSQSARELA